LTQLLRIEVFTLVVRAFSERKNNILIFCTVPTALYTYDTWNSVTAPVCGSRVSSPEPRSRKGHET